MRSGGASIALPISPEAVVREALLPGSVAVVREYHANPAVTILGFIRAGAMYDPAGKEGLALFTASLLTRGTASYTSHELAEILDSLGATLTVRADLEGVTVSARCLAEDTEQILGLMSEVVLRPTFPPEEIEKMRGRIITGIREGRLDTRTVAEKTFREVAYPSRHPCHRVAEGEEASVAAVTREDLAGYHRRHYRPDGFVVAVVGDVAAQRIVERLRALWNGWRPLGVVEAAPIPPAGPASAVQRKEVRIPGKTQADIVLGVPGFARTSPDFYPAMMADLILGRLGLMGRLGATLRDEEGLAYYVYSQAQAGFLPGPWAVRAGVNPRNVGRMVEGIVGEIEGLLREPVRDGELADAQNYLIGSLDLRLETDAGIAEALLEIELFHLGLDYLARYPGLIRGITPEMIGAAAATYLNLQGYTVATAVPA